MRRRTRAGPERAKSRPRKTKTQKGRRLRNPSAANHKTQPDVAQLTRERDEALEQQTATSEVLQVISRSAFDLQPVLDTIVRTASRLCDAEYAVIFRLQDGRYGAPPAFVEQRRREPLIRPTPGHNLERMVRTKEVVHVPDILADPESAPILAKFGGAKALVNVPLLKDGDLIGSIVIFRQEAGPFSGKQIELVKNFAAQAVIAIENTRLLNELRESLERQTATSEVLRVISRSPGEVAPVFQAMLDNATRICEANFGGLYVRDGDEFRLAAIHNMPPALADARRRVRPEMQTPMGRAIRNKQVVHVADLAADQSYLGGEPPAIAAIELGGVRTLLVVPMLREQELIGTINIFRQEVRPFNEKQIELVTNFAAQAVIAIENTRLLNELRQRTDDLTEALEQQAATSEVLGVISSSPGELEPVFQAMLANATRLCE